jgi:hypothetical protein
VGLAGISVAGKGRSAGKSSTMVPQDRRCRELAALAGLILLVGSAMLGYLHYQRQQDLNFQLALALDDGDQNGRALLLLRRGADPHTRGPMTRRTTLWAGLLDERLLTRLLAQGVDPRAADTSGEHPLDAALTWCPVDKPAATRLVRRLLDAGADPNARASSAHIPGLGQDTPLMAAARFGYPPLVALLLQYGAAVNARTRSGETALSIAQEAWSQTRSSSLPDTDYPEVIRLLTAEMN